MNPAPVITGLGFVSSIGHSRADVIRAVRELRHGIAPWQPVPGIELPTKVAGLVRGFDVSSENPVAWTWPAEFDLDPAAVRPMPPHGVYALAAVRQAVAEAGLSGAELGDGGTGLYCASGGSPRFQRLHFKKLEASGWRRAHPHAIVSSIAGALNFHLGAALGIRGVCCGFSSACASGSHALGFALDEIRLGRQQRMIVVAAEDLNAESALPFTGMGALTENSDPDTASRPFDRQRDGFVPAGGAVALVLENAAELLALMKEAGCAQILVGLESPASAALDGIEHKANWKRKQLDGYRHAIAAVQDAGITVNGCFVLGLDGSDRTAFDAVFDFVREIGLYEVQITVMTAFPGAPLYDRLLAEGRVLTPDAWELCTLFDINYEPRGMTVSELADGFRDLARRIYDEGFIEERRRRFFQRQSALRRQRVEGDRPLRK